MTQDNLGNVLRTLGQRKSDPALICEARTCHIDAWKVFAEESPHYCAPAEVSNAETDISVLKRDFIPAKSQDCLARHQEILERMNLAPLKTRRNFLRRRNV